MEVKGRKVKLSIWVRFLLINGVHKTDGVVVVGYSRPRAFPHDHIVVLQRCARDHIRSVLPPLPFFPHFPAHH